MNAETEMRAYRFLFYIVLIILCFNIYYVGRHVNFICNVRYIMTHEDKIKYLGENGSPSSGFMSKTFAYILPRINSILYVDNKIQERYPLFTYEEKIEYRSWWVQSFNSKWHWILSFVILFLGYKIYDNIEFIEVDYKLKILYYIVYGYFSITFALEIIILVIIFFLGSRKNKDK